jgi:hypothetical protein
MPLEGQYIPRMQHTIAVLTPLIAEAARKLLSYVVRWLSNVLFLPIFTSSGWRQTAAKQLRILCYVKQAYYGGSVLFWLASSFLVTVMAITGVNETFLGI